MPDYQIHALKNGQCRVRDYITFHDGGEDTRLYNLYIWLITGGERPMIVETGVGDVEGFSKATEKYIPGGVEQRPEERTVPLLASRGVRPEDVSHVFVTHLHGDHYDSFDLFPNAKMVVNRSGFLPVQDRLTPNVADAIRRRGDDALLLVEDEEPVPGIRTAHLGVHSDCSQAVVVNTKPGRVVLTGDVIYMYENFEDRYAPGWTDVPVWQKMFDKLQGLGDIFVPAHDPRVLERWPGGVIG